jgi:hypothetical protein
MRASPAAACMCARMLSMRPRENVCVLLAPRPHLLRLSWPVRVYAAPSRLPPPPHTHTRPRPPLAPLSPLLPSCCADVWWWWACRTQTGPTQSWRPEWPSWMPTAAAAAGPPGTPREASIRVPRDVCPAMCAPRCGHHDVCPAMCAHALHPPPTTQPVRVSLHPPPTTHPVRVSLSVSRWLAVPLPPPPLSLSDSDANVMNV